MIGELGKGIEPLVFDQAKIDRLKARYGEKIKAVSTEKTDCVNVYIDAQDIFDFLSSIRVEEGFEYNFLADLTAYDNNPPVDQIIDYGLGYCRAEPEGTPRFVVVYHLLSLQNKDRIRIMVPVDEDQEMHSMVPLWEAANWLEREVFDLYGIRFKEHPNLRRIMLDERWVGHPLRKDYPIKKYQRFEDSLSLEAVGLTED